MDTASYEHSIDLSDYVDITKFKSYGGLTQINIFPNNGTILSKPNIKFTWGKGYHLKKIQIMRIFFKTA